MTVLQLKPPANKLTFETVPLELKDVAMQISTMHTLDGKQVLPPLLLLHGFGSTKEDYADAVQHPQISRHPILAYDAPGTGESACTELSAVDIPFLVKVAERILDHFGIKDFFVVGHSMGGLTALLLAHQQQHRVLGFVDIEGNVSPEDCFLSRQVILHANKDAEKFFQDFVHRAKMSPQRSSAFYAASLPYKVRAGVVRSIFESMVSLSDNEDLMGMFLGLPCTRMFMYGEDNGSLSYLKKLAANGVRLAGIPYSDHWPMYSNPVAMWSQMASFLEKQQT